MLRCSNALIAALLLGATPLAAQDEPARPQLALMGTVPIYWGEVSGMGDLLFGTAEPHWARAVLETRSELVPIDYLSPEALAAHRYLLMAQPRGLTADENVALDAWVRAGGRLLLFADPMMTGESHFGIGDRRRPQDVVLLSPLLAHWGLELQFDPAQPEGLAHVDHVGVPLPVNLRGRFLLRDGRDDCAVASDALLARCTLGQGQGQVLLVADAALLDLDGPHEGAVSGFESLLAQIFPDFGESAGNSPHLTTSETGNETVSPLSAGEVGAVARGKRGYSH